MKLNFWLLLTILIGATMLCAQENTTPGNSKTDTMTGWICNSRCVVQKADKATCDKSCTEKDGEAVFIDDKGASFKIANQSKVMADTGKHGKMKFTMDKDNMMQAYSFEIAAPTY